MAGTVLSLEDEPLGGHDLHIEARGGLEALDRRVEGQGGNGQAGGALAGDDSLLVCTHVWLCGTDINQRPVVSRQSVRQQSR